MKRVLIEKYERICYQNNNPSDGRSFNVNNTYIIGHYNPSVRIIDLVFHTPLKLSVLILYIRGGTYSLKSTPNDRFFEKLFMGILFTLRVFARNLLLYFVFYVRPETRILALRLISQHTTLIDYGNFKICM